MQQWNPSTTLLKYPMPILRNHQICSESITALPMSEKQVAPALDVESNLLCLTEFLNDNSVSVAPNYTVVDQPLPLSAPDDEIIHTDLLAPKSAIAHQDLGIEDPEITNHTILVLARLKDCKHNSIAP